MQTTRRSFIAATAALATARTVALDGLALPIPERDVTDQWLPDVIMDAAGFEQFERLLMRPGERLRVLLDGEDVTATLPVDQLHVAHGWIRELVKVNGRYVIFNDGIVKRRRYGRVRLVMRPKAEAL